MALLQALELPFPPASGARKNLLLKKMPRQFAAEIKPVDHQRFVFSAGAALSSWKNGRGYTAGVFGNFPLHKQWSLSAGLQLRYLPLSAVSPLPDDPEPISVQYRYSFGFERTEWQRTTIGLHYLELPVAAHWQRGRLGLEAGVAPAILLRVKDLVKQIRETSLSGIETLTERSEAGEKTRFRSGYFSTYAAAEWRVVSRLGLTLRGNYRPGSILKPIDNTTLGKNAWGLDMGVRWRF